jgi:ABC-2 type transport system permease protein
MKRIIAVIVKEFYHIWRDPTSLTIVILMPVIMIFIFGYSISFDLKKIETGMIDHSNSEISKKLKKKFANNSYFEVKDLKQKHRDPYTASEKYLKSGELKEVIIIPADFSRKIARNQTAEIGVIIDGSDSNVANLVYQYNEMILLDFLSEMQELGKIIKIKTIIHFNPEVKSTFFFIPGIVAVILLMISALLTSLSIAREKESGSIDLIFISPLRSLEIIIGKTIPYIFVALADGIIILFFARFWFNIPFKGNIIVLLVFSLLYIITGLSLGVLMSTLAPSQKSAMFSALLITLLPSIMLSGFIFPLDSLAPILQWISRLIPATYYLKIIRGVVVKGAELKYFLFEGLIMIVFSVFLVILSSMVFNRNRKSSK